MPELKEVNAHQPIRLQSDNGPIAVEIINNIKDGEWTGAIEISDDKTYPAVKPGYYFLVREEPADYGDLGVFIQDEDKPGIVAHAINEAGGLSLKEAWPVSPKSEAIPLVAMKNPVTDKLRYALMNSVKRCFVVYAIARPVCNAAKLQEETQK